MLKKYTSPPSRQQLTAPTSVPRALVQSTTASMRMPPDASITVRASSTVRVASATHGVTQLGKSSKSRSSSAVGTTATTSPSGPTASAAAHVESMPALPPAPSTSSRLPGRTRRRVWGTTPQTSKTLRASASGRSAGMRAMLAAPMRTASPSTLS
ncbi:hypothetical protein D3C72_1819590 [compost metagenome]